MSDNRDCKSNLFFSLVISNSKLKLSSSLEFLAVIKDKGEKQSLDFFSSGILWGEVGAE